MDKDFNEDQIPDARLAILIDADNAQATLVQQILKEVTKYGKLTIRRIYGHTIMENVAHASDSRQNAQREMKIIRMGENDFKQAIGDFYRS